MLTHRANFYTEKHLHTANSYTEKLLHTETFTHRKLLHTANFCTEGLLHTGNFHAEKLLHRETFTQNKFLHREAATQDAPKWEISAAKAPFATFMQPLHFTIYGSQLQKALKKMLHAAAAARNLDAAIPRRSAETQLQNTKKITRNGYTNCSSKTGSRRPSGKTTILKHCFAKFQKP